MMTLEKALELLQAHIPQARLVGDGKLELARVHTDTRTLQAGDLFVALKGERFDAHDFLPQAKAAGAVAALASHGLAEAGLSGIEVPDSLQALGALARAWRAQFALPLIAVTGSNGKTTVTQMIASILRAHAGDAALATRGNFNNSIGMPLNLLRMTGQHRLAVLEMGMNHPGEITPLTTLVRPHIAIITSVEAVHMEYFASTAEIAAAKAEIFDGVGAGGIAILPRDNRHFATLKREAETKGLSVQSFGSHIDAGARLLDCAVDPAETVVFALFGDQALSYRVGVSGRQWAMNSLAVLKAAAAAGVPLVDAAKALGHMQAPKGRGQRRKLAWAEGSVELIDESYNASPVSMRAAIATLAAAKPGKGGRRIAALGDMLELGEASTSLHAGLAEAVVERGIDIVFTAGPLMLSLHEALPSALRGLHAATADALAPLLAEALKSGDVVMIKGSAGSRMGRVVQALSDASATLNPPAQS